MYRVSEKEAQEKGNVRLTPPGDPRGLRERDTWLAKRAAVEALGPEAVEMSKAWEPWVWGETEQVTTALELEERFGDLEKAKALFDKVGYALIAATCETLDTPDSRQWAAEARAKL